MGEDQIGYGVKGQAGMQEKTTVSVSPSASEEARPPTQSQYRKALLVHTAPATYFTALGQH